jgi:hypothetical protein
LYQKASQLRNQINCCPFKQHNPLHTEVHNEFLLCHDTR